MKHPDFDKAFAPTPEIVHLSIEAAFRKGEKSMKLKHKITAMVSAAAVLAIACGVFALALPSEPRPDVVSQPRLTQIPRLSGKTDVYYTPQGTYYHFDQHCSGMQNAKPHSFTEAQADEKKPCPVCVLRKVYATENGKYCHYDEHCSGMVNAIADTETNWYDAGKAYCPICMEPNTWVATDDPYYHYDMACCGDDAVGATENAALELNCFPCPLCTSASVAPTPEPTETAYGGSIFLDKNGQGLAQDSRPLLTVVPTAMPTLDPDDHREAAPVASEEPTPSPMPVENGAVDWGNVAEEQIVYYNDNGKYYHFYMHCSGMMGAKYHTLTEAQQAGKLPCPNCVSTEQAYETTDTAHPDPEEPFDAVEAVAADAEITPAKRASDVFLNTFGVYLFDVFEDYEYISTNARGVNAADGVLSEVIEFCFAQDGWQFTPVIVSIESKDDVMRSGNVVLYPQMEFDWKGFYESASPWFHNAADAASDMIFNMDEDAFKEMLIGQVWVGFDSESKPSVCEISISTPEGDYSISLDINGDEASLATVNYSVFKA